jgi:uncharacterized damage-inducible protein DinB
MTKVLLLLCLMGGLFLSSLETLASAPPHPQIPPMATPPLLHQYGTYNTWANKALALWLGQLSEEKSEQSIESSFTSIKKTISHIWSAEFLWLKVLQGESYQDNPAKQFQGSLEEMLNLWLEASSQLEAYILEQSSEELSKPHSLGADREPVSVEQILQHTLNHSTYHRGQLITMGRQLGLENPPRTDFIHYIRL